ncbi:transmembrane protein 266 isoform X4 [Zalophus californianus]|uniref:Transmembrane protein 266 isoform X4 n=1 Tax=Zalophus californianus TaxID=9704 RepID=A0A6J2B814_ZALCA|nr:transmembrane protein 266 isoform X4 [Zalophus californianus]
MALVASFNMTNPQPAIEGGISEVEIISQQVDEETKSIAPVQLVNFAYRDLPLAAVDLSTAGSQLLSNLDEDYQREGSTWLKPCCGKRAAVWQVFLLSASLNSFLVACVILVVILLTLELLIDIKLLQFSSAFQFAGIIHWISLVILSVFFSEFEIRQLRAHLAQQDLDLAAEREAALQAPHVLSQPRSRYKVVEAGTWAEETAAESVMEELQPSPGAAVRDDMNSYVSQYYNGPSSDSGAPEPALCVVTTAAVDIHRPDLSSDLCSVDVALKPSSSGTCASAMSESASRSTHSSVTRAQSDSSQTLGSSTDCSTAREEPPSEPGPSPRPLPPPPRQQMAEAAVQDLLSSLSEDPCLSQGALDPAPPTWPSPVGSAQSSPELEPRVSLFNQKNQEGFTVFQIKPVIHFQPAAPMLEEKFRSLESKEQKLHRVPEA